MGPSGVSTTVSMASRVVPGMSCTTERSSPISRLNSVLFPTFGRPTMATPGIDGSRRLDRLTVEPGLAVSSCVSTVVRRSGQPGHDLVEEVTRPPAVEGGDRVRLAQAQGQELPTLVLALVVVRLVDAEQHGLPRPPQPRGDGVVVLGDADGWRRPGRR